MHNSQWILSCYLLAAVLHSPHRTLRGEVGRLSSGWGGGRPRLTHATASSNKTSTRLPWLFNSTWTSHFGRALPAKARPLQHSTHLHRGAECISFTVPYLKRYQPPDAAQLLSCCSKSALSTGWIPPWAFTDAPMCYQHTKKTHATSSRSVSLTPASPGTGRVQASLSQAAWKW